MFDRKAYYKKYYLEHKEQMYKQATNYRKSKKGKEYQKKYYEKNKDKKLQYLKDYYVNHIEEEKERTAKYRIEHKDKYREYARRYARNNKDKVYETRRRCYRKHFNKGLSVWEEEYGRIPKGYCLVYKDGNKNNCNLDNLMLIEKKDMLLMVGTGIKLNGGEETIKTGIILAQLLRKKKKIEKGESV